MIKLILGKTSRRKKISIRLQAEAEARKSIKSRCCWFHGWFRRDVTISGIYDNIAMRGIMAYVFILADYQPRDYLLSTVPGGTMVWVTKILGYSKL
jgi:hypothetical protein